MPVDYGATRPGPTGDTRLMCGKWMPRTRDLCARKPGHGGPCYSPQYMERQRQRRNASRPPYDPVAARRWKQAYRLSSYGLTQEAFGRLLDAQGHACWMCLEPFEDGQRICIDHDHKCCPDDRKSCGRCVRGLLCMSCNTALGIIESKSEQASAYLSRAWNSLASATLSGSAVT